MALGCAGLMLLISAPALAVVEATPWGTFDFPPAIRSQREAQAMYATAKVPIVVAIRFLGIADTPEAPWINHYLACGANGTVRQDFAQSLVRASTLLAYRLAQDLEQGKRAATELLAGRPASQTVRYTGPVTIVLEPVRISAQGEVLPPPVAVEPHFRVFVSASVPRCASEATGAFGRAGELPGGFMITASPSLELGWPSYSTATLGQRVVMATDNELVDGFCCGQEYIFGLESLVNVHDFRDYQTKSRLKATLRTLASDKKRGGAWESRVRDAFGLPERFPTRKVQGLQYGTGGMSTEEFVIWPAEPRPLLAAGQLPQLAAGGAMTSTIADLVLGLAWYAHSRADLISPAVLEIYDPERKYSLVGWPEEFREAPAANDPEASDEPTTSVAGGRILEVYGADRKFSFVGSPDAIAENIAFAFAAWRAEIEWLEREVTRPFLTRYAEGTPIGQSLQTIASAEMDAVSRRRAKTFQPVFTGSQKEDSTLADYASALRSLDGPLTLPGMAMPGGSSPDTAAPVVTGRMITSLSWAGKRAEVASGTAGELRSGLIRLYRENFGDQLRAE